MQNQKILSYFSFLFLFPFSFLFFSSLPVDFDFAEEEGAGWGGTAAVWCRCTVAGGAGTRRGCRGGHGARRRWPAVAGGGRWAGGHGAAATVRGQRPALRARRRRWASGVTMASGWRREWPEMGRRWRGAALRRRRDLVVVDEGRTAV